MGVCVRETCVCERGGSVCVWCERGVCVSELKERESVCG